MTIGIGALAFEGVRRRDEPLRPNHLVLIADTLGSFGDAYSHDRLHKTIVFDDNDVYAAASNQVDRAAELMPLINNHIAQTPIAERNHGTIMHAIAGACFLYRTEKFGLEVLPKYRLPPEVFDPRTVKIPADLSAQIQKEWEPFDVGCDLIIGAFDHQGQALLYYVSGLEGKVENYSFPGFCAIGSGSDNAMFWLGYRQHVLNYGIKRAVYHAYEAKLMAEKSPHVNQHLDISIASKGKYWGLTTHRPDDWKRTDSPVNFSDLEGWYKKYGPRSTAKLDK